MKRSNKYISAALLCLILLLGAPQRAVALSPANVVKDRPVTVPATEDPGTHIAKGTVLPYTGARAVDGSTADYSYWYTTGATKTLTVALAAPAKIDRWVVTGIDKNGQTDLYPSDFKLDISTDGTTWTNVDTVTGNTKRICDRSFDAMTAAYVRLVITKGNQRNNNWAAISEFAVYEEVVNSAPVGAAFTQSLLVGESVEFTADDIATDADGDALTITQIVTAPSSGIATATLSAGTVAITGKAASSTTITVKVSDGKDTVDVTVIVTVKARTYILSWAGTAPTFADLAYGYSSGSSATYTVKNTGNSEVTGITATITAGSGNFMVSTAPGATLAPNATATVTVSSMPGLPVTGSPHTGTLTIAWAGGGTGITQSLSQKVNKANNTLSIACANITYGATPAPSVGTNTSGGTVSYEYKLQGAADGTYAATVPTGAGNYTVRGTSAATVNYNAATDTADFIIGKANNTLSIACANITYGQTPAPSVGTNTSGGTVSYEYKLRGAADGTYTAAVPTSAGSYTVRGTSSATANYNAATATTNFTIGKANNTLSISCANITYGQTPAPSVGTNTSGGTVSYEYKLRGAADGTYTATVPTNAGNYTMRGTSAATVNYNATTATADFTIGKATPSLTLGADPAGTRPRPGSALLSAVLPADATGTLTFQSGTDIIATVTLPNKTVSFTPSGPVNAYRFTVEYSGDNNYNNKNSTAMEYSFTKSEQADISAADGTVSYGGTLDVFSLVSGGSGTGSVSFAIIDGPGEISGTILSPTGAGDVNITATKAADNDYNAKSTVFKVTVIPRVITFTAASVGTQTHTGGAVTPTPEVKDGSIVLTEGVHFIYGYADNINAGIAATISITGIGSYAGSSGSVTFTIGGAVPAIITPPVVGGTVYAGTALSEITLTGGEASADGHFEWVNPSATSVYGPNSFEARFVPEDNVLYTQVSGINVTFNAVNRSSGGSSGDDDNSGSGSTANVPAVKPGQPTVANVIAAVQVSNGTANASILDKAITDAIAKAQADASAGGKTATSISVALNISMPQGATSLTATLSQSALNSLVGAGVTSLTINGSPVKVTFDLKALQEIQRQSNGNIHITIVPQANLSASAKAMIGKRPVYDITVSYGSGKIVSGFGGGKATVSIPYTPAKGEAVGALYAVHVDEKGNATRIAGSVYDANSGSILFNTTHFSLYGVGYTAPSAKFTDVANHWAKESIDYGMGRGLFGGGMANKFNPDTAITRGEFVTALGRLAGVDAKVYAKSSFTDVKAGSYYQPYIAWAYSKGVIQGIGNGKFAPDRAITRQEIAVILQNYAKAVGYKLPVTREAISFADASSIGGAYKDAVKAVQQAGIMMGETNNKFNPTGNTTRAEASAMLHRYIKLTIDPAMG